ncbi:thiazole synthase, partial [Morganella morganii]
VARSPVTMAKAFRQAIEAGLLAREAELAPKQLQASASSPLTSFLGAL